MRYLVVVLFFLPLVIWGQNSRERSDTSLPKTQNVIGFVPSEANVINGWVIGYGFKLSSPDSPARTIKGVYTNVEPLNALLLGFASPYLVGFQSYN